MTVSPVRVAIIGCGDIARKRYFPGVDAIRDRAELVAVCDTNPEAAEREAAAYAEKDPTSRPAVFHDCAEMLQKIRPDGAFVATPHHVHAENVIACAEAGAHVATEKPMAATYTDAVAMVQAVERAGVGFLPLPFDYSPGYETARRLIRDGVIGAVHGALVISGHSGPGHAAWFYRKESHGGALIDMGVYGISQMLGIMGPAKRLQAFAGIRKPERITDDTPEGVVAEVEDNMAINLDWGEGVLGSVNASWVLPPDWDRCGSGTRITGDRGVLYLGWPGQPVSVVPVEGEPIPEDAETWELGAVKGYIPSISACPEKEIVSHFVEVVAGREPSVGNGRQQVHVVELMAAAYESAARGTTIELESVFTGYARESDASRVPCHVPPATGKHGIGP